MLRGLVCIFILVTLLLITVYGAVLGYGVAKALHAVEKNGLRHYIERVWEGPQVAS